MNIILILIPVAIAIIALAGYIFIWAVKSDQFEDLDRQGSNILFDDDASIKSDDKNSANE
ncbi:MAG: cbb3-type cytochrome oxidase assembly protein CcoS [Psychrobium sp.]